MRDVYCGAPKGVAEKGFGVCESGTEGVAS